MEEVLKASEGLTEISPPGAAITGSAAEATKKKVSSKAQKVNRHPIMMEGSIRISGPEFKTQDFFLSDTNGRDELNLELRKSREEKSHIELWFDFCDCDIEIKNEVQDIGSIEHDNFYFTIHTPADEDIGFTFSAPQVVALKQMLENYLTAYATNVELKKKLFVKAS